MWPAHELDYYVSSHNIRVDNAYVDSYSFEMI